jgi:hypothetical protein
MVHHSKFGRPMSALCQKADTACRLLDEHFRGRLKKRPEDQTGFDGANW